MPDASAFRPLYEDNHLLVVEKMPDIPVQGDESGDEDLLSLLKDYLKEKYHKPGNVFLGLVHRLDRPARGVMVFARTSKAAARLSDQFRRKHVRKIYRAVVMGAPPEAGTLKHHLLKDRQRNVVRAVGARTPDAKAAELHFRRLAQDKTQGLALIEIELITGRSHQIRVQCAESGFPLWGDYKYGNKGKHQPEGRQLALLSYALELDHPTQHDRRKFSCAHMPDEAPWRNFDS
ncbi:MAG: RluA family pseudouridine synthase [Cyclonatronaceae bacterium]